MQSDNDTKLQKLRKLFSHPGWEIYIAEIDRLIDEHRDQADKALLADEPRKPIAIGGIIEGLKSASRTVPKRLLNREVASEERKATQFEASRTDANEDVMDPY